MCPSYALYLVSVDSRLGHVVEILHLAAVVLAVGLVVLLPESLVEASCGVRLVDRSLSLAEELATLDTVAIIH